MDSGAIVYAAFLGAVMVACTIIQAATLYVAGYLRGKGEPFEPLLAFAFLAWPIKLIAAWELVAVLINWSCYG
jgi:hypothetical protein